MTGGGFGGSAIALVPLERVDQVTAEVRARYAAAGLNPPGVFAVRPSAGAQRVS
jgi:galactokinase